MSSKTIKPQIETSWLEVLQDEFQQPYMLAIKQYLLDEKRKGVKVYPPGPLIFNAFNSTPFHDVKVVILGQDPYHGPNQAHGLCFSVQDNIKVPPSLRNIFKELKSDIGFEIPTSGNLEKWANQGVFLLNAMLTVRASSAASHSKIGWQNFTDAVIRKLSEERRGLIFLLWGNFAKSKATLIDSQKHYVLKAGHPSPLSVRYFSGCRHFSKANQILQEQGLKPIDWQLVE
ncbi:MAG: uracil-DNA glycosylase [Chitinophagales bacterium]